MLKNKLQKVLQNVLTLCFSISILAACEPSELRLASWNIRNINNSRTDAELIVWGETVAGRQAEVMELASVYDYVQDANGAEEDVLLVGDFNRNPDDLGAYGPLLAKLSMIQLFSLPEKSHIRDSSLYDNILFQENSVTEYK